jgi:hypothetical protein
VRGGETDMMRYIQTILYSFFLFGTVMGLINSKPVYASDDTYNEEDCVYTKDFLEENKKHTFLPLGLFYTNELTGTIHIKTTEDSYGEPFEKHTEEFVKPVHAQTYTPVTYAKTWTKQMHDPKKIEVKDHQKSTKNVEVNKDFYSKTEYVIHYVTLDPKKEHKTETEDKDHEHEKEWADHKEWNDEDSWEEEEEWDKEEYDKHDEEYDHDDESYSKDDGDDEEWEWDEEDEEHELAWKH